MQYIYFKDLKLISLIDIFQCLQISDWYTCSSDIISKLCRQKKKKKKKKNRAVDKKDAFL